MSGLRGPRLRLPAVLLAVGLTGCGGILSEAPKRQLYRFEPAIAAPTALPRLPSQLVIAIPVAPAGLDTNRIALSRTDVSLDYYYDAEWTDRAPLLVQTALVEAFERSEAMAGVAREGAALRADLVLETELRDFEAAYDSPNGPPRVLVGFTAKLIKFPERTILAQTTIARQASAAVNEVPAVVRAFDEALGAAAEEVVRWAVTNVGLPRRRAALHSRTRFVRAL